VPHCLAQGKTDRHRVRLRPPQVEASLEWPTRHAVPLDRGTDFESGKTTGIGSFSLNRGAGRLYKLPPRDLRGSASNQRRPAIILRKGGVVFLGRRSWQPARGWPAKKSRPQLLWAVLKAGALGKVFVCSLATLRKKHRQQTSHGGKRFWQAQRGYLRTIGTKNKVHL
jgi:hypothetical protein